MTNYKTREDFEAWAMANKPELLMQFVGGELSAAYRSAFFYWKAATQHSASRIAELEAEVQALRPLARLSVSQVRLGVMCATDFRHELGEASGGVVIYPDAEDLKAHMECWEQCGIVNVEVRPVDAATEAERGGA